MAFLLLGLSTVALSTRVLSVTTGTRAQFEQVISCLTLVQMKEATLCAGMISHACDLIIQSETQDWSLKS